ncbi:hypothetical protein Ahy_B06g084583 [Arachis hypogaea]|uniref:Zinc finger GRF-type domain-containing protein n=1 Tax=Arachis hypogaea TaxID=3818 RepID=A0A444YSA8_ARAHY|nr:hypothetical protein Ahy_B06g084583 [Arachis hypogaea]
MASASNAAGSSNNRRSFGSIMRRMTRNRDSRLPELCGCGSRPSRTDSNPERPFIGCPNYNTVGKRWCRLFMWVDKILDEEVITCDGRTSSSIDNEKWKMKIAWKLRRLESEVRILRMASGVAAGGMLADGLLLPEVNFVPLDNFLLGRSFGGLTRVCKTYQQKYVK